DNQVSSTMIGTYNVTYDVTDAAGNKAERVTRTVNVVDTTKPVIILNGNSTVTVLINTNYTDAGATASDNYDGDLTAKIVSDDQVDTSKVGTYTVTYDVTDAAGNGAEQAMRTVNVTETGGIGFLLILALIVLAILGIGAYIVFVRRSRN
ncbi:MAG: immunoglobulin-like domain-containing protein, partial [Candidatus Micrarchaeota archaeon]